VQQFRALLTKQFKENGQLFDETECKDIQESTPTFQPPVSLNASHEADKLLSPGNWKLICSPSPQHSDITVQTAADVSGTRHIEYLEYTKPE